MSKKTNDTTTTVYYDVESETVAGRTFCSGMALQAYEWAREHNLKLTKVTKIVKTTITTTKISTF